MLGVGSGLTWHSALSASRKAQPCWDHLEVEHPPPLPLLRALQQPQPLPVSSVSRWTRE